MFAVCNDNIPHGKLVHGHNISKLFSYSFSIPPPLFISWFLSHLRKICLSTSYYLSFLSFIIFWVSQMCNVKAVCLIYFTEYCVIKVYLSPTDDSSLCLQDGVVQHIFVPYLMLAKQWGWHLEGVFEQNLPEIQVLWKTLMHRKLLQYSTASIRSVHFYFSERTSTTFFKCCKKIAEKPESY